MKKILYVSNSFLPSSSADTVHIMKMCQAFKKIGIDVALIATKGTAQSEEKKEDLFEFYNIKERFKVFLTSNITWPFSPLIRLLVTFSKINKYDLVYTRWLLAAFFISIFLRKNTVMEVHHPFSGRLNRFMFSKVIKSKKTLKVVVITKTLESYMLNNYNYSRKKLLVLPDGADAVDKGLINNIEDFTEIKCIYLGSFLPGKGIEQVLETAKQLKSVRFYIVGGTPEQILKYSEGLTNVEFLGYLAQKEAHKVLNDCNIALLPNQEEVIVGRDINIGNYTSPMKLFEYMSYGRAIVSSDLPVLREILIDRVNSLLVSPSNSAEWANAIKYLSEDKQMMIKLGNKARNDLEEKYTWDKRALTLLNSLKKD